MSMKTVFISYSHDLQNHRDMVLALSERLREDGIETLLDLYVNGSPAEGWPRWMLDQLDDADFVLVVCTETYYRRFRGHEVPGKGKGVDWEGALITQEIYNERSKTLKFVPVFFAEDAAQFIPEPLRNLTHYPLTSEELYQGLYDFLLEQAGGLLNSSVSGELYSCSMAWSRCNIRAPLLFVCGAQDRVVPVTQSRDMAAVLRSANFHDYACLELPLADHHLSGPQDSDTLLQ